VKTIGPKATYEVAIFAGDSFRKVLDYIFMLILICCLFVSYFSIRTDGFLYYIEATSLLRLSLNEGEKR
jgi:hypothetical protein